MKKSAWMMGLVSVVLGLGAIACSGAPQDDGSGSTDDSADELRKAKTCGGIAALQCPSGYECELSGNYPDASGTCKKAKKCGGFAGIQCPSGYECELPGQHPDEMGVCKKAPVQPTPDVSDFQDCQKDSDCARVSNVEKCCGDCTFEAVNAQQVDAYQNANWCPHKPQFCPMACRLDTRVAQCNVGKHKCEMVEIKDIACGGFTMNPHKCPTGYSCDLSGHVPDVPGKCVQDQNP